MHYLLFPLISLVLRELQQYSTWFVSRRFIDDSNNVEHIRKEPGGQWKQYFSQIAQSPSISHDDISVLWAFKQPRVGTEIQCVSFVHVQILMCANKWLFSFALVEFVLSLVLCVAFIYSWIQIRARARVRAVGQRNLAANGPQRSQPGYPGFKWLLLLSPADQFYINSNLRLCLAQWRFRSVLKGGLAVSNKMNWAGGNGMFSQRSRWPKMALF